MKARPLVLVDFVNGADVGMIQRRGSLCFALETRQSVGILARDSSRKELERDKAVQSQVFGLVHHAHAAAAQLVEDAVVGDRLVDHLRRILGLKVR